MAAARGATPPRAATRNKRNKIALSVKRSCCTFSLECKSSVCTGSSAACTGIGSLFPRHARPVEMPTFVENFMQVSLRKSLIVSGLALGLATIGPNASADSGNDLRWKSVIGIMQANSVVGTGTGAVNGAPGPWSALGGSVNVDLDRAKFAFDVHGLVLAAGNFIGTPGTIVQVKGTLVCDTDGSASGGNSVLVDTPLVVLDDDGDARFHGTLGPLPAVCTTEPDVAFLVRTSSGRWIGNGTVLR